MSDRLAEIKAMGGMKIIYHQEHLAVDWLIAEVERLKAALKAETARINSWNDVLQMTLHGMEDAAKICEENDMHDACGLIRGSLYAIAKEQANA